MIVVDDMIGAIREHAAPLRSWKERRGKLILWLAIALFVVGTFSSLVMLDIAWSQSGLIAMAILTAVMGVVMLVYSAVSLVLMARGSGGDISFGAAMRASSRAQMAEALPLPGGAIVRTMALVEAGVSITNSVTLVLATALLWIALASIASGVILLAQLPDAGVVLLAGGIIVTIGAFVIIAIKGTMWIAALTLFHRLVGIGIAALRLSLAFAVINFVVQLPEAMPYALAAIAGSASSLVPGGLGVSEALGALMASAIDASPQAAFLALAINRVAQFLGTALFAPLVEAVTQPTSLKENEND